MLMASLQGVKSNPPLRPKPITDAYGILVKNVEGTSDNLLITGCEIQGNADVQIMVEAGANIKIMQNQFKVDDLDIKYNFPSIDVQVGRRYITNR